MKESMIEKHSSNDLEEHFKKSLEKKRWGILIALFFYTYFFKIDIKILLKI